jgi:molecular chaperone DnaJ
MERNYYIVLGISRGASKHQIKKAYRDMAKRYHPDGCGKEIDEAKFREIQRAYETLSDRELRDVYDAGLIQPLASDRSRRDDPVINAQRSPLEDFMHDRSLVDEFLNGWLPGDFSQGRRGAVEKDLAIEMVLEPSEARDGGLFPLTVPVIEFCTHCGGAGYRFPFVCRRCRGNGRVRAERSFSISIPPNTKDHTEVTLALDDIGLRGVALHLFIRVAPIESV